MRLTENDKRLVLERSKPDAKLRRLGDAWAVIWNDWNQSKGHRWQGKLVASVDENGGCQRVWFTAWCHAASRKDLVAQLTAEAQR